MPPVVSKSSGQSELQVALRLRRARRSGTGSRIARSSFMNSISAESVFAVTTSAARDERPGRAAQAESGLRAVRVAMRLAQILIEPARERAAQDRVHHLEREVVARRARRADRRRSGTTTGPRPACRRSRPSLPSGCAACSVGGGGTVAARPPAEDLASPALDVVRTNVADDEQRRVVRSVVGRVEALHFVARDGRPPSLRCPRADVHRDAARRTRRPRRRDRRSPARGRAPAAAR